MSFYALNWIISLAQAAAATPEPALADLVKIVLGQGLNGVLFFACVVLSRRLSAKDEEVRKLETEYRQKVETLKDDTAKKVDDGFAKLESLYNKQIEREERTSRLLAEVRDAMRRIGVTPRPEGD